MIAELPNCNKCGQSFGRSNIAANSPTCEECLIEELEKYPIMPRGIRRKARASDQGEKK